MDAIIVWKHGLKLITTSKIIRTVDLRDNKRKFQEGVSISNKLLGIMLKSNKIITLVKIVIECR